MDALDVDHESTPGQYMVRDRQDIVRLLIKRGCKTDLLMATAIGDASLVGQHLDWDPDCIRVRVNEEYFPKANPHSGGTIYQWTLGWHVSAHDLAKAFGHEQIFGLLMERSPADVKLLVACWLGDEAALKSLTSQGPGVAGKLSETGGRQVADAARNNNLPAVRLMLLAGLPVNGRGQHGATPLHWAAFHGNAEMIQEILHHQPALEINDRDFNATPVGWAIYGSKNGWHCQSGNYSASVEALLKAGAKLPSDVKSTEAVQTVVEKYRSAAGLSR
jgi:hypothetical protein